MEILKYFAKDWICKIPYEEGKSKVKDHSPITKKTEIPLIKNLT